MGTRPSSLPALRTGALRSKGRTECTAGARIGVPDPCSWKGPDSVGDSPQFVARTQSGWSSPSLDGLVSCGGSGDRARIREWLMSLEIGEKRHKDQCRRTCWGPGCGGQGNPGWDLATCTPNVTCRLRRPGGLLQGGSDWEKRRADRILLDKRGNG